MKLIDFVRVYRTLMPEEGLKAINELIPVGDETGVAFPIEGECCIPLTEDCISQRARNQSNNSIPFLPLPAEKHSFSLYRLYYSVYFPGKICADIYDSWEGRIYITEFESLSFRNQLDIINGICMLSDEYAADIDLFNSVKTEKKLHIDSGEKFHVDSFVMEIKKQTGAFSSIKVQETLSVGYGFETIIEIPTTLNGINRIKIQSDLQKKHILHLNLYGEDLKKIENLSIPQSLCNYNLLYRRTFPVSNQDKGLAFGILENHLNSIEIDALQYYLSNLNDRYATLFKYDLSLLFKDIFINDEKVKYRDYFPSVLSSLPAEFKAHFTHRLIENIPFSKAKQNIELLKELYGHIVRDRMTTLPGYKQMCIILNVLESRISNYFEEGFTDPWNGHIGYSLTRPSNQSNTTVFGFSSNEVSSSELYYGQTIVVINEPLLNERIGEDFTSLINAENLSDFSSPLFEREPLKDFLWWGAIGPAHPNPERPNHKSKSGILFLLMKYSLMEKSPSNSFLEKQSTTFSKKGVEAFILHLKGVLTTGEIQSTTVSEQKHNDGTRALIFELPSFAHRYRTIELLFHNSDSIEGIMLSGIKLHEIAKSFSGTFMGVTCQIIMERTDTLIQNLFLRVV